MKKILALVLTLMFLVSSVAFAGSSKTEPSIVVTDTQELVIVNPREECVDALIDNIVANDDLSVIFSDETVAKIVAILGENIMITDVEQVANKGYTADKGDLVITFTLETPFAEGQVVVLVFVTFDAEGAVNGEYVIEAVGNADGSVTATINVETLNAITEAEVAAMVVLTAAK